MFEHQSDELEFSDSSEILIERFIHSGQTERAIEAIKEQLARHPEEVNLHLQLARCYYCECESKKAKKELEIALSYEPDCAYAHYLLSKIYFDQPFKTSQAIDSIHKALNSEPDDADYWCHLALIHEYCDDFQEATEYANKGLNLEPNNFEAKLLLAKIKSNPDNPLALDEDSQVALYHDLLSEDPESTEAHIELANIFSNKLNQYKQAIHHYEAALKIDPTSEDAKSHLIKTSNKSSLFIQILHSPAALADHMLPMRILSIVGLALRIIHAVILAPIEIAYNYLTLADTRKKLGQLHIYHGFTAKLHKSPFGVRFGLFLILWLGFMYFWYHAFTHNGTPQTIAITLVAVIFFSLKLLFVIALIAWPIFSFQKWRRARKSKALNMP